MKSGKDKFKLVTEYPVTEYRCGLTAGDRVRLKKDLQVMTHKGKPTGKVHRKGDIWTVLSGTVEEEGFTVWFRQTDGTPHTWDDDSDSINEWFEVLK